MEEGIGGVEKGKNGGVFKAIQGGALKALFHPVFLATSRYLHFTVQETEAQEG